MLHPKTETVRRIRGVLSRQENILFPGYLFFDSADPAALYEQLKKIPEFTKLLGADGVPKPLYPHEEEFLKKPV